MIQENQENQGNQKKQAPETDSSTRLMMEQIQAFHRRLEAETIEGLIHHAQSLDEVRLIVRQRRDSLLVNEHSLLERGASRSEITQ